MSLEVSDIIYPDDDPTPQEDRVVKELVFHIPDSEIVARQPLTARELEQLVNALQNEIPEPVMWGPEHEYFREDVAN